MAFSSKTHRSSWLSFWMGFMRIWTEFMISHMWSWRTVMVGQTGKWQLRWGLKSLALWFFYVFFYFPYTTKLRNWWGCLWQDFCDCSTFWILSELWFTEIISALSWKLIVVIKLWRWYFTTILNNSKLGSIKILQDAWWSPQKYFKWCYTLIIVLRTLLEL